jgi:FtsH-binding integral membrane protein
MAIKPVTFFKTGAWILTIAGFAHGLLAITDVFVQGAFSPVSSDAILTLKNTSLGIVNFMRGYHTSLFESAWGAYIGFAIGFGLITGFSGLILVITSRREKETGRPEREVLLVSIIMSGIMLVLSGLFFLYLPTIALAASFICFAVSWFAAGKKVRDINAAG